MELWSELVSDWVGTLSFGVIALIILMALFFVGRSGDPKACGGGRKHAVATPPGPQVPRSRQETPGELFAAP